MFQNLGPQQGLPFLRKGISATGEFFHLASKETSELIGLAVSLQRGERAPKRALKVLGCVWDGGRLLEIVGLIQVSMPVNVLTSAAVREVSAAERFRRGLG